MVSAAIAVPPKLRTPARSSWTRSVLLVAASTAARRHSPLRCSVRNCTPAPPIPACVMNRVGDDIGAGRGHDLGEPLADDVADAMPPGHQFRDEREARIDVTGRGHAGHHQMHDRQHLSPKKPAASDPAVAAPRATSAHSPTRGCRLMTRST
jgi:hypothetical protein